MWNYLLCKSGILLLLGEMGPYPHETSLSNESVCACRLSCWNRNSKSTKSGRWRFLPLIQTPSRGETNLRSKQHVSTFSPKVCTHATQQTICRHRMHLETCVFVCLDVVYFMPCVMCSSLTLSFETLNTPQLLMSKSTQDKARHHRR